jgi:hypothetical protein
VPLYYFGVRNGLENLFDEQGVELRDIAAAEDYARGLARELMFGNEARKRHWWVSVHDADGNELFGLPFMAVDDSILFLSPESKRLIHLMCERRLALAETVSTSRLEILRARATIARGRSRPYLAAYNGHRVGK